MTYCGHRRCAWQRSQPISMVGPLPYCFQGEQDPHEPPVRNPAARRITDRIRALPTEAQREVGKRLVDHLKEHGEEALQHDADAVLCSIASDLGYQSPKSTQLEPVTQR